MLTIVSTLEDTKFRNTLVVFASENTDLYELESLSTAVSHARNKPEFNGKKDEELILYHVQQPDVERLIVIGLGAADNINREGIRTAMAKAVKTAMRLRLDHIDICMPTVPAIPRDDLMRAGLEGVYLANYIFDRYKEKKDDAMRELDDVRIITADAAPDTYAAMHNEIRIGTTGTRMVREWVTLPGNELTPERFAADIRSKAADHPRIKVTDMDETAIREKGFAAIIAVGQGSENKPRFVILDYNPGQAERTIALVGKAVTFDSGGLNLKPSDSMNNMKSDMGGGAVAAATTLTAAGLGVKDRIIAAIPMVENMPSGTATRTGDIISSYSGKTIEIANTDAEGRLILADALTYIREQYKPDLMLDLATLTGACVVALGEKIAGVFSFDDNLADAMVRAGEVTHERCWRLPLPDDYKELLKSDFADLRNVSSKRWGGSITAALFLSEFVGDTPWIHLDIAGPVYAEKGYGYVPTGGTGFGVRLLCNFLFGK